MQAVLVDAFVELGGFEPAVDDKHHQPAAALAFGEFFKAIAVFGNEFISVVDDYDSNAVAAKEGSGGEFVVDVRPLRVCGVKLSDG